jgi:cyclin-dependent kinase
MIFQSLDDAGHDLLEGLLVFDPSGRMSAKQACSHDYFKGMRIVSSGNIGGYTYVGNGTNGHTNGFH